ncbi:26 kDa periplasmic immunogenic protein [Sporomusa rhizae]|uniref:SIMPL domain-containing protein n=1 Tax=Sporomusa rhizae TaxID=357999 RepID=UPI00352A60AF
MYKTIKTLVLALLITVLALPAALAAEKNPNATEVQVSGNYQEEIAPDTAYINLGTVTEAETLGEAQAKNADISAKLRNKLEIAGIKSEYIKTANYDVTPLYKNDDNGRRLPSIKGYQVTNSIIVTTVPDKAGEVIDTALNAGANQVNNVRFGKNTDSEIKNAALAQAVRDALRKADAIAAALNKQVVRIKTVNENSVHLQSPEIGTRYKLSALDAGQSTPISAGLITLTANVQVVVELE